MRKYFILIGLTLFFHFSYTQTVDIQYLKNKINSVNSPYIKAQYLIKLASLYQKKDSISQAINAYKQALKLIENTKNYTSLFNLNSALGVLYSEQSKFHLAEEHFTKAVHYAKLLGNNNNLSQALLNLGNVQQELGKYKQAISTYEEALSHAFNLNNLQIIKHAYTYMSLCYKALGDNERYIKYLNLSSAIDKKIKEEIIKKQQEEALKQKELARKRQILLELSELQKKRIQDSLARVNLENEQNKMKIALLEKEKKLSEAKAKQREAELKKKEAEQKLARIIIYSLTIVLIIILIFGIVVYKQYILIRKKNEQLAKLNNELTIANKKLENKNKIIEKQNKQIKDSIIYASRIQKAILPSLAAIKSNFPDGEFIFYLPRDVVSGDFYWFNDQGEYKFLALVDCTGHSVPGAFMSLIGNTLLNEIIKTKHIFDPSVVLKELHNKVIELLHNKDEKVYDGMDIALLRFEPKKNQLIFASANQPMFLVHNDGNIKQVNGDIFSIGGYFGKFKVNFKNTVIELKDGINIYLSSDGYFDQFNEKTKEKFTRKRFIKLLSQIYTLPFNVQYKKVYDTFNEWKGNYRQIDDVLVIGLRYNSKKMLNAKNDN